MMPRERGGRRLGRCEKRGESAPLVVRGRRLNFTVTGSPGTDYGSRSYINHQLLGKGTGLNSDRLGLGSSQKKGKDWQTFPRGKDRGGREKKTISCAEYGNSARFNKAIADEKIEKDKAGGSSSLKVGGGGGGGGT